MPEVSIQTDEFMKYIEYEEKLTKLYQLVRDMSKINQ